MAEAFLTDAYLTSDFEPDAVPLEASVESLIEVFGFPRHVAQGMMSRMRGESKGCCVDPDGNSLLPPIE